MKNKDILILLENYVPRSVTRSLVGTQFFDALVSFDFSVDIYQIEVLASKIRMSKSALKKVYSFSSGKLPIGEKEFIETYILKKQHQEELALPNVKLERKLHDFQYRSYRVVLQKLLSGEKKILLHLPTGAGKTRTASEILMQWLSYRRVSSISDSRAFFWIAQSAELCEQAYEALTNTVNVRSIVDIDIVPLWGGRDIYISENTSIYVVTVQKLSSLIRELNFKSLRSLIDLIVFDEAHFVGEKWYEVLDWFTQAMIPILGLTATPGGQDVGRLSTFYRHNKVTLVDNNYQPYIDPIGFLREKGYLADLEIVDIETGLELNVEKQNEEFSFNDRTIKKMVVDKDRNVMLLNAIESELDNNRKVLVFACSVDHCYFIQSILLSRGYVSEVIEGNTDGRESIINSFKSMDSGLNCILNFNVLTAGFDAPQLDTLIIGRAVSSVVQYSQMLGRVLRGPSNGGNKMNKLITFTDNVKHGDYNEMLNRFNEYYI